MPAEQCESGPLEGSDGEIENSLLLRVTQGCGSTAGMRTRPASVPLTIQRLNGTVDLILGFVCVFSMVDNSKVA